MDDSSSRRTPVPKKAYQEPSLLRYGSIAKLTQNGTGSGADGGSVGKNKMCL